MSFINKKDVSFDITFGQDWYYSGKFEMVAENWGIEIARVFRNAHELLNLRQYHKYLIQQIEPHSNVVKDSSLVVSSDQTITDYSN